MYTRAPKPYTFFCCYETHTRISPLTHTHTQLILDFGYADATNLAPMYDVLASAIREADDEHIIVYEGGK